MSNLKNTSIDISGNNIRMSVPFSKIDTEKRMVHGFATLDNLDKQDDIVLYTASLNAFNKFRGNIREMHSDKAVGKMVSFRPETYYDEETDTIYNGIFVSAYVSKGAQDTWEKVIDETLTGFSIGGNIEKAVSSFDEDLEKTVRIVEDYSLSELSLVDNPANQLANVIAFEKGEGIGYISKTEIENVFYCRIHNVVQFSSDQMAECHECHHDMVNIGFVESNDPDKIKVIKGLLSNIKNVPGVGDTVDFDDGIGIVEAIHMSGEVYIPDNDNIFKASEYDPVAIITICEKNDDTLIKTNHRTIKNLSSLTKIKEVEKVGNKDKEVIEPTVDAVDPVIEETVEISKADDPIVEPAAEASVDKTIEKSDVAEIKEMLEGITKALAALPDIFTSVAKSAASTDEKLAEMEGVVKSATSELATAKEENEKLGKRLESVEASTAFRKSADVGDIVQAAPEVQSIWGGRFLERTSQKPIEKAGGENMSEENKDDTLLNKATAEGAFVVGGVGGVIDPADSLGNAPVVNYGQFGTPTSVSPSGGPTTGMLPPEAANRFIDYIWDATVLAKEGRHVSMRANTMELSKVNVGERIIRGANQADGDYINTGAKFSKIELTTKKVRLDWEISSETLEDGLEGAAFEDHVVRLMTNQFANDLEDLAINGIGDNVDPFLGIMKGFVLQAQEGGHQVVNSEAIVNWTPEVMQTMIDALPRRFRALKNGFRWYTGTSVFGNIVRNNGTNASLIYTEGMRQTYLNGADQIMGQPGITTRVLGIPVIEVPYFPEDYVELTFPQNRVWGIQREIKVNREYVAKKDTWEWVVYMRFGLAWEELDAMAWMDATGTTTTTSTSGA